MDIDKVLEENEINVDDDMEAEARNDPAKMDKLIESGIKKIFTKNDDDLENSIIDPDMKLEHFEFTGCLHENITPKEFTEKLVKSITKPAKEYEFVLDKFQERAVLCLENGQSVLVSAHTSAGKTAVAQYAIAMALRDKQRVIYTSPIKALSNQKYRELQAEFKDVGLMTGDVTINPGASCIVMTTEILRNMLYKGSEITREMAWVIFDEVHYMRDKERGVVWEETMILLPNVVKYVFLSATIPNAREFAMWICKIKGQPCNVVYTDYRPVPLQHYVYVPGSEGIYLVVDEKGNFKEENFSKAVSTLNEDLNLDKLFDKKAKQNKKNPENDIKKIISLIKENSLDPAIIFSFSKKECEAGALALSKMDLTTEEEKELIEKIYNQAISTISEEDQSLPQIQMMLPLLKKGIGIHHGGLLPIVKESVELIFQEGLVKALFSTETFSMGINMPAKTVVFTSIEKWDGNEHRWLTGGEYIQMSGRAGRRGIDDRGITIMMLNKKIDTDVCKGMLSGKSDALNSTFHLSYNMITNLTRVEGIEPEYIIKRSFHQFQAERQVPVIKLKIKEMYDKLKKINIENNVEKLIKEILNIQSQIENYQEENSRIITLPENIVPFLAPGRLIKIRKWGWGICVNFIKKNVEITSKAFKNKKLINDDNIKTNANNNLQDSTTKNVEMYFVDTLLYVKNMTDPDSKLLPGNMKENDGQFGVVPVVLNSLENISSIKLNLPHDLKDKKNLKQVERLFGEVSRRFKGNFTLLDPINEMGIKDEKLEDNMNKLKNLNTSLQNLQLKCDNMNINDTMKEQYKVKDNLRNNILTLITNLNKMKELVLKDDLKNMKRVLRRLDFISGHNTMLPKGQVACIISSADELLLTEMLFNGSFNEIEPNVLCGMLSCFLSEESKGEPKPSKNAILQSYYAKITESAKRVADVLVECKIKINKEDYIETMKADFMEIAFEWANGAKFAEICKLTDIYEGNIIVY
jgi:ATP-dependent RNA helicase DOB1